MLNVLFKFTQFYNTNSYKAKTYLHIIGILENILDLVGFNKDEQRTFTYCECGNELCSSNSFIRDVYLKNRNVVHYKCSKCKNENFFDFDHPVPLKLPFSEEDKIVDDYRREYEKVA